MPNNLRKISYHTLSILFYFVFGIFAKYYIFPLKIPFIRQLKPALREGIIIGISAALSAFLFSNYIKKPLRKLLNYPDSNRQ